MDILNVSTEQFTALAEDIEATRILFDLDKTSFSAFLLGMAAGYGEKEGVSKGRMISALSNHFDGV